MCAHAKLKTVSSWFVRDSVTLVGRKSKKPDSVLLSVSQNFLNADKVFIGFPITVLIGATIAQKQVVSFS